MDLRSFLKPNWKKVLIALILMGLTFFFSYQYYGADITWEHHGLPLPYFRFERGGRLAQEIETGQKLNITPENSITFHRNFFLPFFIIDLIFWYLISSAVFYFYDKVGRGTKQES